ncbi:MAG TPA: T9SS type A sorting domain-containing protein [Candidatus Kapabacteria bacterium]|nr:T9SS type A sorting domain-containing protein [Candidatus Kapabacteria bacterium]
MTNVFKTYSQEPSLLGIDLPSPCNWSGHQEIKWKGPFEIDLCDEDLKLTCSNCCLTIVYYERYVPDAIYKFYESNVVGVLWHGAGCPCNMSMDEILLVFENKLFKSKSIAQPGFWVKFKTTKDNEQDSCYLNSQTSFTFDFYVSGACYQKDSNGEILKDMSGFRVECDTTKFYCCRKTHWVTTYTNSGIIDNITNYIPGNSILVYENSNQYHGLCDTLHCVSVCNDPVYDRKDQYKCKLPQNCTTWDKSRIVNNKTEIFCNLISGDCINCCFTVTYDMRETKGCLPGEYYDFTIKKIDYNTSCNDSCSVDMDILFDAVIDALLTKSEDVPKPKSSQCEINYRFYTNTCWFDHELWGYRTVEECSDEFNCCFRLYKVCASDTDPVVYRSEQIGTSIPVDSVNCNKYVLPHPCYFLCGDAPLNIIKNIEEINEYNYQVTIDKERIMLQKDVNKNIKSTNQTIEIYDINGNLIHREDITNNKKLYFLENINNIKYLFVIIKENGRVVYNGKFIK